MSAGSKIEWTENTWNPVTGCTKISAGCQNCYAFTLAHRLQRMGNPKYSDGFEVTLHDRCLTEPLSWRRPALVFVNSMSDLFHEDVPLEFIQRIFHTMNTAHRHTFQVLTKRADRLAELAGHLLWTPNIWLGVTVEDAENLHRLDALRSVDAAIRFVSFEPLLGEITHPNLTGIDWAIIGGESGHKARPIREEWVLSLKEECERQRVMFYFKQWGGSNKKKTGRLLLDRTWDDMPDPQSAHRLRSEQVADSTD